MCSSICVLLYLHLCAFAGRAAAKVLWSAWMRSLRLRFKEPWFLGRRLKVERPLICSVNQPAWARRAKAQLSLWRNLGCGPLMARFASVPSIHAHASRSSSSERPSLSLLGASLDHKWLEISFLSEESHWMFIVSLYCSLVSVQTTSVQWIFRAGLLNLPSSEPDAAMPRAELSCWLVLCFWSLYFLCGCQLNIGEWGMCTSMALNQERVTSLLDWG